jgi:FKBP-type peptidyl-prolyl cis-trans isomerase 2
MAQKRQQHVQQSMTSMVNNAAMAQFGDRIVSEATRVVQAYDSHLQEGTLALHTKALATALNNIKALTQVLEAKGLLTQLDLDNQLMSIEDSLVDLQSVEVARLGATVRIKIGDDSIKVEQLGAGQTIAKELEDAILGMSVGHSKDVEYNGRSLTIKLIRASEAKA